MGTAWSHWHVESKQGEVTGAESGIVRATDRDERMGRAKETGGHGAQGVHFHLYDE